MAVGATESTVDFEHTPGGAVLMNGIRLRDEIVLRLRGEIEAAGSPPVCLATVLVGVDKPSQIYLRLAWFMAAPRVWASPATSMSRSWRFTTSTEPRNVITKATGSSQ